MPWEVGRWRPGPENDWTGGFHATAPDGTTHGIGPDAYDDRAYIGSIECVRGVGLAGLRRVLTRREGVWGLWVSWTKESYFKVDEADRSFWLVPSRGKRFDLVWTCSTGFEVEDTEHALLGWVTSLLTPLLTAHHGRVESVEASDFVDDIAILELHCSVSTVGKTVGNIDDLVHAAERLLAEVRVGKLNRTLALEVLRAGLPEVLIGSAEGRWLDAKRQHFDLSNLRGKIELAQDIARFCNAEQGGLLIVGMTTKRVPGGEVVAGFFPIAADGRDTLRYAQAIERHVHPPPDDLEVFIGTGPRGPLLVISIPPQPEELKPFLVHGAIVGGEVEGAFISIVRRRGEHSIPITAPAIHSSLVAGRALLRGAAVD